MTEQQEIDNLGGEEPVAKKPSRFDLAMLEMAKKGMTAEKALEIADKILVELQNPQSQEG